MSGDINSDMKKIKTSNYRKILRLLMREKEISKQEIVRRTKISITTIISNINRLIENGLAEEAGTAHSTGGRKPVLVRFLPNANYAFGVDFASNHLTSSNRIQIILVNLNAEVIAENSLDYKSFTSRDETIHKIKTICFDMMKKHRIDQKRVIGIGFALPGTVNEKLKILELAPNLLDSAEMKHIDFKPFEKLFPFPLYVENEANTGALAEITFGVARHKQNFVYLSINRGISAGIAIRTHLYKGNKRRAGEIGHTTVASNGIACTCGGNDCWEIYAASGALIRNYNQKGSSVISSTEEFHQKLLAGDRQARKVWDLYLGYLSVGINNILLNFDPRYIIIGGEISEFDNLLIPPLVSKVFSNTAFFEKGDVEILISTLKTRSSLIGAALLALQVFLYGDHKVL
ncbi:MAG: ROK family protein [Spirochaetales bacterium]|nr:MAG: ROK family protein [Spirochaetales bacterium]